MTTKSEYRDYIQSEAWRKRRKEFLASFDDCECNRCGLPRWLAVVAYDQDIHVHHRSYANVGAELDDDLELLCKRCHDIESFGKSELHEVRKTKCISCNLDTFNLQRRLCDECYFCETGLRWGPQPLLYKNSSHPDSPRWEVLQTDVFSSLEYGYGEEAAVQMILNCVAAVRDRYAKFREEHAKNKATE